MGGKGFGDCSIVLDKRKIFSFSFGKYKIINQIEEMAVTEIKSRDNKQTGH